LRERSEDIPPLARGFVRELSEAMGSVSGALFTASPPVHRRRSTKDGRQKGCAEKPQ
jgi:transcriptional regulator with AAA-type ATPase domain